MIKDLPASAEDIRDEVRKIHWRRAQQPTPVLLPGESYAQRTEVGYGP